MSDATLRPTTLHELTDSQSVNEQRMDLVEAETIATYRRVSTLEQDASMQQIVIERNLLTYGVLWENAQHFLDDGVSAFTNHALDDRDAGQELMDLMRTGAINKLFVYRLDRLFRNTEAAMGFIEILRKYEVELFSTDFANVNLTTADGRYMYGLQMLNAERESGVTSERSTDGMDENRRRGIPNGKCPPYGWEYVEVGNPEVNDGKGKCEPNWDEQMVMEWAAIQRDGMGKIADRLNARKLWTKMGRKFSYSTIHQWRENPSKQQQDIELYPRPKRLISYPFRKLQNRPINTDYLGPKTLLLIDPDAPLDC